MSAFLTRLSTPWGYILFLTLLKSSPKTVRQITDAQSIFVEQVSNWTEYEMSSYDIEGKH